MPKSRSALSVFSVSGWIFPASTKNEIAARAHGSFLDFATPRRQTLIRSFARWSRSTTRASALLKDYLRLDAPWAKRVSALRSADWASVPLELRPDFMKQLATHADAEVRSVAARVGVAYRDQASMVTLVGDPCFYVRKSATYYLRDLAPNAELARYAWSTSSERGSHGTESLESAIALDPSQAWIPEVTELVRGSRRDESFRFRAVHALGEIGAKGAIQSLLPLLEEPPRTTWSVQLGLLQWGREFGLALPDLSHLEHVDCLELQVMLTESPRDLGV